MNRSCTGFLFICGASRNNWEQWVLDAQTVSSYTSVTVLYNIYSPESRSAAIVPSTVVAKADVPPDQPTADNHKEPRTLESTKKEVVETLTVVSQVESEILDSTKTATEVVKTAESVNTQVKTVNDNVTVIASTLGVTAQLESIQSTVKNITTTTTEITGIIHGTLDTVTTTTQQAKSATDALAKAIDSINAPATEIGAHPAYSLAKSIDKNHPEVFKNFREMSVKMVASLAKKPESEIEMFVKTVDTVSQGMESFQKAFDSAIDAANKYGGVASEAASSIKQVADKIVESVDQLANVHPIVKMSWMVLSAGYKVRVWLPTFSDVLL
ncbi:UNVERIFIED_CONTAM: hypothetical protein HDU68_007230 [Siphonaria sp. JEL0065]|nr:hypothetical protein HDU68_007230 [Siphonaria sp. JEL0065]